MANHIEIAEKFIQEQLHKRNDIIGVLLVGSVARGEETESSDIDLRLIIEPDQADKLTRDGLDAWRDGVYIDATPIQRELYADIEKILENPIRANDMNSGLIIYDPTGFLVQMQKETQALFMAPKWVAVRVKSLIERLPQQIIGFQEAVEAKDHLKICIHTGRIMFGFAILPLIQHGIAPSSTRHMVQLGELSEKSKIDLCELEGSLDMEVDDVLAALSIFSSLSSACDTSRWGHLPEYMVKKVGWMAKNGYHWEAIHTMWINTGFRANDCLPSNDPQVISEADQLVQEWLRMVNWKDQAVLAAKLKMVNGIWAELEASTAHYFCI